MRIHLSGECDVNRESLPVCPVAALEGEGLHFFRSAAAEDDGAVHRRSIKSQCDSASDGLMSSIPADA